MRFFALRPSIGSQAETEYEPIGQVNYGEAPRCPNCGRLAGMMPWLPPYRVHLHRHGPILGDVAFGTGNNLLLSQAFVAGWSTSGLKGLGDVQPVEIASVCYRTLARTLQPYYQIGLQPITTCIDRSRSVIIGPEPECMQCGGPGPMDAILALSIDESSWSGEDIFVPWGVAEFIVTQHVVDMAREHGLTNVTTTPLEEYRWDPLRMYDSVS